MMRREMRARRRLGANSRSTDVVVTPWADEYVPAPCADLPTYPPCHAGAGGRTYLPTPPLISEVGLPTMKKHKTLVPLKKVWGGTERTRVRDHAVYAHGHNSSAPRAEGAACASTGSWQRRFACSAQSRVSRM